MDSTNGVNPAENNASTEALSDESAGTEAVSDDRARTEAVSDESARQASREYAAIAAARSYDEQYRFGRQPTSRAPFPFTEREFARLLIVRGRILSQRPTFGPAEGLSA